MIIPFVMERKSESDAAIFTELERVTSSWWMTMPRRGSEWYRLMACTSKESGF